MTSAVCIGLFALAFLVRDGFPATGETQLARFLGGVWCMGGASAVLPLPQALAVGLAIWLGFYTDQKHAEGQQARDWQDAGYLALSGVTSLAPLAVAFSVTPHLAWPVITLSVNLKLLVIVAAWGLAKIPIWFAAWRLFGENKNGDRVAVYSWAQPTRIAAIAFGALVGLVVELTI